MLDTNMKTQLKAYLEKLTKPVELIATLDDGAKITAWRCVSRHSSLPTQAPARARVLPALRWDMNSPL